MLEIASIDSFQGREKDFILISTVRSNHYQNLGFLTDFRRLNVSITRARQALIIIGDASVLTKDPYWGKLLESYSQRKILVEDISEEEDKFKFEYVSLKNFKKAKIHPIDPENQFKNSYKMKSKPHKRQDNVPI